jgi:transposase
VSHSDKQKHNGKRYDKQFKLAAVKLVTDQGYTPKQASESLGVHTNTLQYWIKIYGTQPDQAAETIDSLRLKLKQLEKENQRLVMEKDILKKATAFFASQQP